MGPLDVIKNSPIADPASGWVDVEKTTARYLKQTQRETDE